MPSSSPLVSIIIPTYNRAHLIGETLDSVLAQTYQNWECIVVDDGSTDGTFDIIESYLKRDNRFSLYIRDNSYAKGANSCRHIGYLKSNGEYINWFDSDDLMDSQHIGKKVREIVKGNYDFVVCEIARFKGNNLNNLKKVDNNYESGYEVINQFVGELTLFTPGPLWSKSFLEKKSLRYKQDRGEVSDSVLNDWVFGIKALLESESYFFIKEPLVYYRSHGNSIYSDRINLNTQKYLDEFKIRKKVYNTVRNQIGYNKKIEEYYLNRNLKILRVLLIKKTNGLLVLIEILKNRKAGVLLKGKIVFYYITSVLIGRGINKLRV